LESRESSEIQEIRSALGAIANAEPAVYWLFRNDSGKWCVRREGEPNERKFHGEDAALAFIRMAVVRCSSYCLFRERADGCFEKEFLNWLPAQAEPIEPSQDPAP
jgi:hypothetical protein